MLKLFIETDNAAFEDEPATELARILRAFADALEQGEADAYSVLRDINGNRVGEAQITSN